MKGLRRQLREGEGTGEERGEQSEGEEAGVNISSVDDTLSPRHRQLHPAPHSHHVMVTVLSVSRVASFQQHNELGIVITAVL